MAVLAAKDVKAKKMMLFSSYVQLAVRYFSPCSLSMGG
jgi:hypothetical protein